MNFKRVLYPLITGTLLFAPIFGQPSHAANQYNSSNEWEFITDAADGTLYFGGKRTTVGKTTVVEIKAINDPDEPVGKEYMQRAAFKCDTNQVKVQKAGNRSSQNQLDLVGLTLPVEQAETNVYHLFADLDGMRQSFS